MQDLLQDLRKASIHLLYASRTTFLLQALADAVARLRAAAEAAPAPGISCRVARGEGGGTDAEDRFMGFVGSFFGVCVEIFGDIWSYVDEFISNSKMYICHMPISKITSFDTNFGLLKYLFAFNDA